MKKITYFFAITLAITLNLYSQFVATNGPDGGAIYCLYSSGSDLYAGTQYGGVFKTANNGYDWSQLNNGMGLQLVNAITVVNNTLFAGTNSGLYRSLDGGANWLSINYGVNYAVTALTINGADIYLGSAGGKVYKSVNNGTNWAVFADNITEPVNSILFHNGIICVAVNGWNVYASSNNGASWVQYPIGGSSAKILFASGNIVRAGTNNGGKKSPNPMLGWSQDIPWINTIYGYAQVDNYIIAAHSNGVFWSSNNGSTWNDQNQNFNLYGLVWSMAQNSQYVFAGKTIVYRKPVSDLTGLSTINTEVPADYSLSQNYPNPFNPATNIKFGLPKSSNVVLRVYNQLGETVSELVNQNLGAGLYEYNFDASAVPSGVYFYKLTAGDFTQTKKMILIK